MANGNKYFEQKNDGFSEDMKNHMTMCGWIKLRETSDILYDKVIPVRLKGKMHTNVIRPTIFYFLEC